MHDIKTDVIAYDVSVGVRDTVCIEIAGSGGLHIHLYMTASDAARMSYRIAEHAKKVAERITYWATPEEVLGKPKDDNAE